MADNVQITEGSGTAVHSDEYTHSTLGSGKTQLVKLVNGTLDSSTAIGVADIGVKANAIRVCPASDVTDATYIGDIKFGESLPAGTNGIGKLTANSGVDIGDVDVTSCDGIAAEAAALGNGILIQGDDGTDRKNINVDATTGDVQVDVTNTITETNSATIAGDTTSIDGKITACNTGAVTISAALPAGTNNIGDVDIASSVALDVSAATVTVDSELTTDDLDTGAGSDTRAVVGLVGTASGGGQLIPGSATDGLLVNLGTNNDITLATLPDTAGGDLADIETNTDFGAVVGGGVEATALRVTIANDSTGLLSIDDGGGNISVDWAGTVPPIGAGTEAAALRVTMATDSTGVLSIDDNGGAITVDNGGTFAVQSTLQANSGVDIGDVDVTSIIPGTGATNLGKAVDSAGAGTDTGIAMLAIRDDTLSALTPIEGDYVRLRVNSQGALHVTGSAGSTQYAEDAGHTTGDTGTMALVVRYDAGGSLCGTDLDYAPLQVNSSGALRVTGGGGGTEYNEDDATPATIVGTATLMERDDALATVTPIEGDWLAFRGTAEGALWVQDYNSDAILADTASMDTNLGTLAGAVTGTEMQVDIVADGAGLSTAANQSTIIGHVDGIEALLTTIDADTSNLSVVGGGTEAAAIRVTLANNSTGVLSVDDNGGNLSVDWGGTVPPIGAGVEATALRVTLATDSTGLVSVDDNGSSLTVDTTGTSGLEVVQTVAGDLNCTEASAASILTAVQIMDDWDDGSDNCKTVGSIAHDAADSGNPVKVGYKAYNFDGTAPGTAVAEADRANGICDTYGRQYVETIHPNSGTARDNKSTAQTNTVLLAAPGAGLAIYVEDIVMSTDTAMNIKLVENTAAAADKAGPYYFAANGGATINRKVGVKLSANVNLGYTSSGAGNHTVEIGYRIVPA